MPINFENTYVNPNIKIESREVPLEQLEKTANIIQERYDTSRENYNQAGEALRLLESSANPIDREQAKLLRGQYEDQLNELGKTDDFQKHGWRTKQLAGETAANYNKIVKRNEDIQAKRNEIIKNTKWDLKKAQRLAEFDAGLTPIAWDAENRTLGNTNVDTYSAANDYNVQESMFKYRTGMNPVTIGNKTGVLKFVDANGQQTTPEKSVATFHVTSEGQTQVLDPKVIQKAVYDAVANDEGFQAAHQRDLNYEFKLGRFKGIDPNSPEGQQAAASFLQSELNPKAESIGQLTKVYNEQTGSDVDMNASPFAALNIGSGQQTQNQYDNYSPVDNYVATGETEAKFPDTFKKAVSGTDHKAKGDLMSTLDYMSQNGYPQDAKKLKEYLVKYEGFIKQHPEWAGVLDRGTGGRYNNPLGQVLQIGATIGQGLNNLIDNGMAKTAKDSKEIRALRDEWDHYVNQGLFSSDFEKAYLKVTSTPAKTRVVPMVAPGLGSAEIQGKIKALNLTQDQFDIEGGWNNDNNHVEIVSHSVEPIGSGKGIMYTLQDNSGKTYNAFAKKQGYAGVDGQIARTDNELNKNIKYRGVTIPRYTGQKLTFEQIAEDANIPDMAKKYPGYSVITNKDNTYSRVNPQGAVEATAGSVFDLLP
jgi:hypothetical protein